MSRLVCEREQEHERELVSRANEQVVEHEKQPREPLAHLDRAQEPSIAPPRCTPPFSALPQRLGPLLDGPLDPVGALEVAARAQDLGRLERGVAALRDDLLDARHALLALRGGRAGGEGGRQREERGERARRGGEEEEESQRGCARVREGGEGEGGRVRGSIGRPEGRLEGEMGGEREEERERADAPSSSFLARR